MTDPEFADRTYIEPLTVEVLARIIDAERPDALLPTIGGQTALNLALDLAESGRARALRRRADRRARSTRSSAPRTATSSRTTIRAIGLDLPRSGDRAHARGGRARQGRARPAGHPPAVAHARRHGRRLRHHRRGVPHHVAWGLRGVADQRGPDRGVDRRLEGVRARGDARRARTTSSSSARSRTSTRWACTPATRSPWRRRRR